MSKITSYIALTSIPLNDDVVPFVDVHDTTMAATGTTKKIAARLLAPMHKVYIDQYGADPTGATASDSAWTAAYTAATNAITTLGGTSAKAGAVIVFGEGLYTFSTGTISITNSLIGMVGAGKAATVLRTTGSGILVNASGDSTLGGAPIGGFTLYGWDAGSNAIGMRFGDRPYTSLFDVYYNGWNAGTTSTALQVAGTSAAVAEGVDAWGLAIKTSSIGFSVDGTLGGTSADYSRWKIHSIDQNIAMQFVNGGHIAGGQIHLTGTCGSANWTSPQVVLIGNSTSDTALLQNCFLDIGVECDSGSTTPVDITVQGTSAGGIQNCTGQLMFLNSSGTYSAGSIGSGGARFSFTGAINGSPTLGLTASADIFRQDLSAAINYRLDAVQTPASNGTIHTATDGRFGIIPVNPSGAITGVILEKPAALNLPGTSGIQVTIINRSANSITFAASGTSNVADGVSDVIAASHGAQYTYDPGTSLWYRT